ncbi:MAG: carboxymuconolactone decarboxylase family protein [Gammaproteobacteria bacterium]
MTAEYKLSLPAIAHEEAEGEAKAVLDKALKEVGFIPNMYARMAHLPGLLDTYLCGYGHFRKQAGFTPAEQEVVFLTISRENGCHYCVAAHSMLADTQSGVPTEVTDAIRDNSPITDPKLAALSEFTRVMNESRGLPSQSDTEAFLNAGYSERHILGVILAIAVKTLSNYSNHLFHTPMDEMFASRAWKN